MNINSVNSDVLSIISKSLEQISELPKEIAAQNIDLSKKLIEVNTVSKVLGLGNFIDSYA